MARAIDWLAILDRAFNTHSSSHVFIFYYYYDYQLFITDSTHEFNNDNYYNEKIEERFYNVPFLIIIHDL